MNWDLKFLLLAIFFVKRKQRVHPLEQKGTRKSIKEELWDAMLLASFPIG
jgi:hypothetical protein